MTSDSKDRELDTPQDRLNRLLMALANIVVQMKGSLEKDHIIPTAQVSEAHTIMGELTWTAGAVEAVMICKASDEQPKIEVVH